MRASIAFGILGLSVAIFIQPARAGEGRVSEATATLENGRVANYTRTAPQEAASSSKSGKAHANAKAAPSKTPQAKSTRPAISEATSSRSSFFEIYDAGSSLRIDRDRDGYYSEFQIRFDADSFVGDTLVYARLYLRRVGDADWELYHTTDDFWIYGESDSDDYYVTTTVSRPASTTFSSTCMKLAAAASLPLWMRATTSTCWICRWRKSASTCRSTFPATASAM